MYGYGQPMDGGAAQQQYAPPQQQMPGGHGGYGQQPPLYPEPSPPSLADAVRAYAEIGIAEVMWTFRHPFDIETMRRLPEVRAALA